MLTAMALFCSMGVFIRLSAEQIAALEVVFFRNFLAIVIMTPWLLRGGYKALKTNHIGLLTARSIINVIGMAAGFTAVTLIPLAEATALGFTAPLWTTIGAVLILGEVIRKRRVTALAIGFFGVLVVLRPGLESISLGSWLALLNAFLIAITTLIVKRLTRTERPDAIVAWMVIIQTPLSLIPALFAWQWPDPMTWLWLWCLALAGTLGHMCWTRAYMIAEVSQLQPLEFAKLPMIALFAFIAFTEVPTLWTWVGGTVIFASTAYISIREAQVARQQKNN
jgi:drug/metabolite transporter (DMT)-like permease